MPPASSDADIATALAPHTQAFASDAARQQFLELNGHRLAEVTPVLLGDAVRAAMAHPSNAHFLAPPPPKHQPGSFNDIEERYFAANPQARLGGLRGLAFDSAALASGQLVDVAAGVKRHAPPTNDRPIGLDDVEKAYLAQQATPPAYGGVGLGGPAVRPTAAPAGPVRKPTR